MLQLKEQELGKVLKDFYTLTKIRIVVFDSQMQEVLSYPKGQSGFCALLRQDPQLNARCTASDQNACRKCAQKKEVVTYRCHMGLVETVVPIQDDLGTIGYLMFGQVLQKGNADAVKAALHHIFHRSAISDAIAGIPVKTEEELSAAVTVLQALTAYVCASRLVMPRKSEFLRHLDSYISAHLTERITADVLCKEFRMNRTRFYEISSGYLGMGVAEYVRHYRIEAAKKLLMETDHSVTKIANATGFADYTHFSKVFRQEVGMSARTFRRNGKFRTPEL